MISHIVDHGFFVLDSNLEKKRLSTRKGRFFGGGGANIDFHFFVFSLSWSPPDQIDIIKMSRPFHVLEFPLSIFLAAEAKIWSQIQTKLASIPHSIDQVCMPLVKKINNGQFYSTVDKREQLSRHQAQGGYVPFSVSRRCLF